MAHDDRSAPKQPGRRLKILFALTYYRPHISGLTIYVERLARALAQRGHSVTVLTSRYDRSLPPQELVEGVRVIRAPVALRVSKGVIMPGFGDIARALLREHDIVSIHLPQFDAAGLAFSARFVTGTPVVLTYHCDVRLPDGLFNRVVDRVVFGANYIAATLADRIVAYTDDYAAHSPLLSRFRSKWAVIPPPVVLPPPLPGAAEAFAERWDIQRRRPVIGFVARLATEKGVEVLVEALPRIMQEFPDARVFFAGPYRNVLGEEAYAERLQPLIERLGDHWVFLGTLDQQELTAMYPNLDLLVLPSLNSTESFGLVQVEAMLHGTPVVASNLPGVRVPVQRTGMGEIAPIGDAQGLAEAILRVLRARETYIRPRSEIAAQFDLQATLTGYEQVFQDVMDRRRRRD
jgi:glycosyltransferase involved in cell wall biosynthesis